MTNNGVEFDKKKMGLRRTVYQIRKKNIQEIQEKKNVGWDKQWIRIL